MSERRDITLAIGEQDFTFTLAPQDVTKYFNAVTPNNKVAPSNNLLTTLSCPPTSTRYARCCATRC